VQSSLFKRLTYLFALYLPPLFVAWLQGPRSTLMKSYAFNAPQSIMALTSTMEMLVVALITPVFVWIAARMGKKRMYMFLVIGWAVITMGFVMIVQDYNSWMYWVLELGAAALGDTQTVFAQVLFCSVLFCLLGFFLFFWVSACRVQLSLIHSQYYYLNVV
jgi:hypothetical protein